MKNKWFYRCVLLLGFGFNYSVVYAAHNCVGSVEAVDVNGAANVFVRVSGIGDGNLLCSLQSQRGNFSAEACKAVFSLVLSAKAAQKNIRLYFHNDSNTSCAKGNWKDFSSSEFQLYHVRLQD